MISLKQYFNSYSQAATLAFFRLAFGLLMVGSLIRFASFGWIEKFYITPQFHFTYFGFEWVKPLGFYTYFLFLLCGIHEDRILTGPRTRECSDQVQR